MNKKIFIKVLKEKLKGLSEEDLNKIVSYYEEMIDDKIESGKEEEEVIEEMEDVDSIASRILNEVSPHNVSFKTNKKLSFWLMVLGSPLWVSLLVGMLSAAFAIYIGFIALVIALVAALVALSVAGLFYFITTPILLEAPFIKILGIMGISMILIGLSIHLYFPTIKLIKQVIKLHKLLFIKIKSLCKKKEVIINA